MVINKKMLAITFAALIAKPALGMRVSKTSVRNVAYYLAEKATKKAVTKAPRLTASPTKVASRVSNLNVFNPTLNVFNPTATYDVIKSQTPEFTVGDALALYKGKYASLVSDFSEVAAAAIYNPTNILDFMARNNLGKTQMSQAVAQTTKEFIEKTARYMNNINRELVQDLKATELGMQTSEYAAKLKADAQAAMNQIQAVANDTLTNLKAVYAALVQDAKQTAINFAELNQAYIAKAAQQAAENPKSAHGLFAATMLAGTAGYMGYEANKQSDERKTRKASSLIEQSQQTREVAPVDNFDPAIEQAKRELAEADALWEANQAIQELQTATVKPVVAVKDGELAVGPVGFRLANITSKLSNLAAWTKTNLKDNYVTNYVSSWFKSNK